MGTVRFRTQAREGLEWGTVSAIGVQVKALLAATSDFAVILRDWRIAY
jgi:hypothetical protein